MEILNQLGELFLAAVPTVIIVFLFYFFMRWSFFRPMMRVLDERQKRAQGARADAEHTLEVVHEKQRAYSDSLKKARTEIFKEQEALRRRALDERQATINTARTAAQNALQEAKKEIAADVAEARKHLEASSETLAGDIADAILAGVDAGPVGSGERESR